MKLADLDVNKLYTYFDYLKWTFEERVELIKGRIFEMSAPSSMHQEISSYLNIAIGNYLKGKECKVFAAPYDVRIPRKTIDDKMITTVLQPDICVVCDKSKRDPRGCIGAPDIIIEILSPGNYEKELKNKYDIYEEAGVKEYWVVIPMVKSFVVHTLKDGKYQASRHMLAGDVVTSSVLPGFSLDIKSYLTVWISRSQPFKKIMTPDNYREIVQAPNKKICSNNINHYLCTPQMSKGNFNMLIIDSKDCENIDKALKKYKKKYEKSRVLNQLRDRQSFTKPSIRRRTEVLKAVYKQQLNNGELDT
jgi:ribosomal protein S21